MNEIRAHHFSAFGDAITTQREAHLTGRNSHLIRVLQA